MPVTVANHGGVGGKEFGNVEQVGSVGEGGDDWDTGADAEERFVGVEGKMGEADGFQVLGIGHWAPPIFGRWWVVTDKAELQTLDGTMAGMQKLLNQS